MGEGGYRGGGTIGGKVGCAVAGVIAVPLLAAALFVTIPFGDCPPDDACHNSEGWRMLGGLVVVALIAASVGLVIRQVVNALAARSRSEGE